MLLAVLLDLLHFSPQLTKQQRWCSELGWVQGDDLRYAIAAETRTVGQTSLGNRLLHILLTKPSSLGRNLAKLLRLAPRLHFVLEHGLATTFVILPILLRSYLAQSLDLSFPLYFCLSLSLYLSLSLSNTEAHTHSLSLSLIHSLTTHSLLTHDSLTDSLSHSLSLSVSLSRTLSPSDSIINFTSVVRLHPFDRQSSISSGLAEIFPEAGVGVHIRRILASIRL